MSKKVKEYSELKKRALLAKQRMKMGYWQQMMNERENMLSRVGNTSGNQMLVSDLQRAKVARDNSIAVNKKKAEMEEAMYQRVCEMLSMDEYVSNPIGRLVDHDVYDNLSPQEKQKYIFDLSAKYRRLKERYNKERLGKTS